MSGRHVARSGAGGAPGLGGTGLVRRGLAVGVGTTALLVVLAAVAAAFLVVTPRTAARAADAALADAVTSASAPEREIRLRTPSGVAPERPEVTGPPRSGPEAPFAPVDAAVRQVLGPDVTRLLGSPSVAAETEEGDVTRDGRPLTPDGSIAVLRVQSDLAERVGWVEGGPPGAPEEERTLTDPSTGGRHRVAVVPVAVPDRTAEVWGLSTGDELVFQGPADLTPAAVVVSGVYTVRDPADGFWQEDPRMTGLTVLPTPTGGVVTTGALVAAVDSYGPLSDAMWRAPADLPEYPTSPVLTAGWRYPLDPALLRADDAGPLRAALVRLDTDARLSGLTPRPLTSSTGLAGVLDGYDAALRGVAVLTSFATAGLTALVALVLALTAVVALRRRRSEVLLVRARGGGVGQVLAQTGTATALAPVPVVLVVAGLVAVLLPGTWGGVTLLEVALVALVPLAAATAVVLLEVRGAERSDDSDDAVRRRRVVRRARRVVVELAVLAVAVLAVTTVRARGGEIAGGRTDWFAALTPVLTAAAAAVVALRVLPWPVGLAARLAERRRGVVAFLGLARAARTGAAAVLPVVAVVVGSAVLALFASLALSAQEQRAVAAVRDVGGPVRVDAVRIDPDDAAALGERPGVRTVLPAYVGEGSVISAGEAVRVVVVATDPAAYQRLLAGTAAPVAALPPTGGDRVAVVGGPGLPGGPGLELSVRGIRFAVDVTATDPGLVRVGVGASLPAVLVPLDRLREVVPAAQPQVAFLDADPRATAALQTVSDPASLTPSERVLGVDTTAGYVDRVGSRALPRLVAATYLAGAVLAAVLTLLAVLLLLAATRPERAALVVRLRTMGLPHGGERALAWTEVLPVVAVAALAGAAVGTLAPSLVAPAVDLGPFTGGPAHPPVEPHLVTALGSGALVLVLGALALVIDAAVARRGRLADHLRRGDTA